MRDASGILGGVSELWSRPLPLALATLALLWLLVWLPRRVVATRGMVLLRCLVPAWRFFEDIDPVPALRYRVAPYGEDWGDWQDALSVPRRTLGSLLANAAGNLHLAQQSLIEHLVADLEETGDSAGAEDELISYRLVCALIEQRLRRALPASPAQRYQFCLVEVPAETGTAATPLFLSRVHGPA